MNGPATFAIARAQGDYALRIRPLRAAKPFTSNQFHGERETADARQNDIRKKSEAREASRFETASVRFSRAPRASSAFAAQVLGQILIKNEHKPASTAYRKPARILAQACDLSV